MVQIFPCISNLQLPRSSPGAPRFPLRGGRVECRVAALNRSKSMIAVLLLAVFALASSHPLLQGLDLIHQHSEHHSDSSSSHSDSDRNHDAADGLCRVDSHRNELEQFSGAVLHCLVAVAVFLDRDAGFEEPKFANSIAPPPELVTTWQFSSRAALPVRAPSFPS